MERIYVHSSIYDQFVDEFVAEVKTFKIGDPAQVFENRVCHGYQESTYIGPLTLGSQQVQFLEKQVKDALGKGAKLLLGGKQSTVRKTTVSLILISKDLVTLNPQS